MKRHSGFSIVEMLVVLTIVAVAAMLAMPEMRQWAVNQRLKRAAIDLFGELQLTKLKAIKQNKEMAVFFDKPHQRYLVCSHSGDNDWATLTDNVIEKIVNLSQYENVVYGRPESSSGDVITYLRDVVVFTPNGLSTGWGYVHLKNDIGTVYRVGSPTFGVLAMKRWVNGDWR